MIVIRLEFSDQTFISNATSWQQILFGTQEGELNHYYHEVSQNQFEFSPVADKGNVSNGVATVTFDQNHPDPDINANPSDFEGALHPFLKAAIEQVSADGFDFQAYDTNDDDSISPDELIVTFIMAGEEDAYSGGSSVNGVWAHQYCTEAQYTPNVNGVYVMGCNQDGKYAIFGERHHDTVSTSHDATVGIIAHELGHAALGLVDLYDVTYNSAGIGYFGLMSSGTWGQASAQEYPGQTPVPFSAWSKIYAGWFQSAAETGSNIELNGTGYSNYNIVKVPISCSEYFLLENRSTAGYDQGLAYPLDGTYMGGLAIWHIDEYVISSNLNANTINTNVSHKGVDLEEASNPVLDNGWYEHGNAKNLYYSGNKTEFSPITEPNSDSYYSSGTGIAVYNISAVGSTMTVDIINPN